MDGATAHDDMRLCGVEYEVVGEVLNVVVVLCLKGALSVFIDVDLAALYEAADVLGNAAGVACSRVPGSDVSSIKGDVVPCIILHNVAAHVGTAVASSVRATGAAALCKSVKFTKLTILMVV